MAETGLSMAQQLLARENARAVGEVRDQAPDPEFHHQFESAVTRYLRGFKARIPVTETSRTETQEGTVGFLPPGAKAEVAKAVLRGHETPPVRTFDEEVGGDPVRQMDTATIHVVCQADALTAGSRRQTERIGTVLTELRSMLSETGPFVIDPAEGEEPTFQVGKRRVVLHIIKKDPLGHYALDHFGLTEPSHIDGALAQYQRAANWAQQAHPEAALGHNVLDGVTIGTQLYEEIKRGESAKDVRIPLVVQPQTAVFSEGKVAIAVDEYSGRPSLVEYYKNGSTTRTEKV